MPIVILSGIPGSGKTTLAHALCVKPGNKFRWMGAADDVFETPEGYKFDYTKLSEAHGTCFRGFIHASMTSKTPHDEWIVVHNTALSNWEKSQYVGVAQAYSIPYLIVSLNVHPLLAGPRNTHEVPADRIMAMWERREKILPFWTQLQLEPCEKEEMQEKWVKPILEHFAK